MVTFQSKDLDGNGKLSGLARQYGIRSWDELILYVNHIPYGRNTNRTDLSLVLTENKGTCSSKHGLLASIAIENKIPEVQLACGIFRMHGINTPVISNLLREKELAYIPEAHCYLLMSGKLMDITFPGSAITSIEPDIMEEIIITSDQVGQFKIDYHQDWLKKWVAREMPDRTFEEIWAIREAAIQVLSEQLHQH